MFSCNSLSTSSSKVIFSSVLLIHPQFRNIGKALLLSEGKPGSQLGELRRIWGMETLPTRTNSGIGSHVQGWQQLWNCQSLCISTEEMAPLPSSRTPPSSLSGWFSLIDSQCPLFSFIDTSVQVTLDNYYSVWLRTQYNYNLWLLFAFPPAPLPLALVLIISHTDFTFLNCLALCVCVCVCVCEREREREMGYVCVIWCTRDCGVWCGVCVCPSTRFQWVEILYLQPKFCTVHKTW